MEKTIIAENDIYDNKSKNERFKENLSELVVLPKENGLRVYYCKNGENLEYFWKLFVKFEIEDISFIRRCRLLHVLKIVVHNTTKNLRDICREDIDGIVGCGIKTMNPKTASDFKKDIKHIWRVILPDVDEKGRPDETIVPYVVRHLKTSVDKSKQKSREDKLTYQEFEKLIAFFANKPCIQAFLMLAIESIGRPQELLWRRIKDVELLDQYAKIHLTDHGKEGIGILQCIDAYSYLTAWLNVHPFKNNPQSFLFINEVGDQLKPTAVNKHLKNAREKLGIHKPVTCYSWKRNGVTFRRLRGDRDVEIQHAARWSSTKQLKTYDMSDQEDAFKLELIKRGLMEPDASYEHLRPKTKPCLFCHTPNKFTNTTCITCNRPLDRNKVIELEKQKEIEALNNFMQHPQIQELFKKITMFERKIEQSKEA